MIVTRQTLGQQAAATLRENPRRAGRTPEASVTACLRRQILPRQSHRQAPRRPAHVRGAFLEHSHLPAWQQLAIAPLRPSRQRRRLCSVRPSERAREGTLAWPPPLGALVEPPIRRVHHLVNEFRSIHEVRRFGRAEVLDVLTCQQSLGELPLLLRTSVPCQGILNSAAPRFHVAAPCCVLPILAVDARIAPIPAPVHSTSGDSV
mmetsp:Transcript_93709/g.208537  ORF Transcript_93709/g.208537 Transcript_93709/m.208537 type:complete len:205 (+) Transcript_93709:495-1109(+)